MNRYPIWIGLCVALIMVCVTSSPVWWMLAAAGMGANGLVVAANGWKMPVRGSSTETIRHKPLVASTRHKWLADIIPVGFGKASVGDFLLCAGMLGAFATRESIPYVKLMAVLGLAWWAAGWVKGFGLFEKWTPEARRDSRKNIPIVLVLMLVGNLLHVRGCGLGELHASATAVEDAFTVPRSAATGGKTSPPWRDLGTLMPPPMKMLTRLKIEAGKRTAELERKQTLKVQGEARLAILQFDEQGSRIVERTRQGPFCHVTCLVHHGDTYDRETLPELCTADWIPPNTVNVPGWFSAGDALGKFEVTYAWPGPATPGFHRYKLYWK